MIINDLTFQSKPCENTGKKPSKSRYDFLKTPLASLYFSLPKQKRVIQYRYSTKDLEFRLISNREDAID